MFNRHTKKGAEPAIDPKRVPRHVAIIMDGNGRWAKRRGLPRIAGHKAGVKTVDRIVQESIKLGIEILTLYTFSTENWSRPKLEIKSLMDILYSNLISQTHRLKENGVKLRISGDLTAFPERVVEEINRAVKLTADGDKLILNLALGYSGRTEIVQACRAVARDVAEGKISPDDIDDALIESKLYTAGLPDPELIIRTSGEYRLSNFLLWQCSYSELYFTKTFWPNFSRKDLVRAIVSYQARERRFGGVNEGDQM